MNFETVIPDRKTQFASIFNIMTPEKKLCQIKRSDRDSNLQRQQVQLLLEPIVDKRERFIRRRLNQLATECHNQSERKDLLRICSERLGNCSEGK